MLHSQPSLYLVIFYALLSGYDDECTSTAVTMLTLSLGENGVRGAEHYGLALY
jgi:hypothetical protein